VIGYYAHHHGAGHAARATAVAAALGSSACTVLSSLAPAGGDVPWVVLDRDDDPPPVGDPTASGALHWAPTGHPGMRSRQAAVARWLGETGAPLLVSDVSVEVLLLARLLSVRAIAVALRGDRSDRAHALGYDAAEHIVAAWPQHTQHEWPDRWLAKTTWVGGMSRYDGRTRDTRPCPLPGRCVLLLLGAGGHALSSRDLAEAAAVPGTHWHVVGTRGADLVGPERGARSPAVQVEGWVPDVWPYLCRADVVVAGAGDNAVAEVAAAGRPLVAVPQPRPFGEQVHQARVLREHDLAEVARPWPDRREWPVLLDRAAARGGDCWGRWSDGRGAERTADLLRRLAYGSGPAGAPGRAAAVPATAGPGG
jgi:hypothetical protein